MHHPVEVLSGVDFLFDTSLKSELARLLFAYLGGRLLTLTQRNPFFLNSRLVDIEALRLSFNLHVVGLPFADHNVHLGQHPLKHFFNLVTPLDIVRPQSDHVLQIHCFVEEFGVEFAEVL